MIIDCISDLHGFYPKLEGGDLLIIAGDLTARDTYPEYEVLFEWLRRAPYKRIVLIAGNHDGLLQEENVDDENYPPVIANLMHFTKMSYLSDSGMEFEGLKIWGSPWTPPFCDWHFMLPEEKLKEKYDMIPFDTDILITHGPPMGILDTNREGIRCGSVELRKSIERIGPKYAIFGHIHEAYGEGHIGSFSIAETTLISDQLGNPELSPMTLVKHRTTCLNVSHCDRDYNPVNPPIRIKL